MQIIDWLRLYLFLLKYVILYMPISIEEFEKAIRYIEPFVKTTPLEHYRDNIYLHP